MSYRKISKTEVRQAINRVASTEDGQILLAVLAAECGFFKNKIDSNPNVTQVYAAQRGIYAKIRNHIRPDLLRKSEYGLEIEEDEIKKKGDGDE